MVFSCQSLIMFCLHPPKVPNVLCFSGNKIIYFPNCSTRGCSLSNGKYYCLNMHFFLPTFTRFLQSISVVFFLSVSGAPTSHYRKLDFLRLLTVWRVHKLFIQCKIESSYFVRKVRLLPVLLDRYFLLLFTSYVI